MTGSTLLHQTTLSNGLRVISQDMPAFETASLGVWVDAGARWETPELNGISHLLEHMAFKGTERRSARQIAEEIEAVGGHINAYTTREHTAYFAKVLKEDLPMAVDVLADILQNSAFEQTELERERSVVIQEIGQAHDTPDDIIFDHFQEAAYPNQPLGRPVLGSADGVAALTRNALQSYMAHNYTPNRMVLAAAGRIDHDKLVDIAEQHFTKLGHNGTSEIESARYVGGDTRHERDLEQAHLVMGLNGVTYKDDDYYATQILSTLLGGGMSSRLFQEIREQRGLAYSIFSFAASYVDDGLFGIYAGCGADACAELAEVICQEVRKVAEKVDDAEVSRARAQLKSGLLMSLESSHARCEQLARQLLIFGRPFDTEEIVAKIDAVDADRITTATRRLLEDRALTVAAVGPVAKLPDYDTINGWLA